MRVLFSFSPCWAESSLTDGSGRNGKAQASSSRTQNSVTSTLGGGGEPLFPPELLLQTLNIRENGD